MASTTSAMQLLTGARTGVASGASTSGAHVRPHARSQAANAMAAAHHGVEACGHQGRGPCGRQGTWARRSRPPGRLSATAGRLDGAARGHRCTRAPASDLAATRVSLPCALPSVAPLSSAPRVPTPAPPARPPCSLSCATREGRRKKRN